MKKNNLNISVIGLGSIGARHAKSLISLKKKLNIVYHHIGVYAYKPEALKSYIKFPQGILEKQEGLEQLRFIENDINIKLIMN